MSTDTPTSTETPADLDETDAGTESYGPDDGALVADGPTKRFGGLVPVDDLSLAVEKQEILGFIGPNAAGQSPPFTCSPRGYSTS